LLTCKQLLDGLNDYLDEKLDAETRALLEAHVGRCPNCWVIVDTTKKTLQVYRGMEPKQLPQDIHDRLMRALQKKLGNQPHPPQ
jgi:anti-sigma factor RsiW